ncbi:hypothetical protein EIP91_006829 [Steccherinum ochraceum]|uniref:F-box domain-containing protein n=1 Tax=Steccherinum ochraceum TaxID=92696 RepID=A0A4R0R543_9APHY|nr:hypothetical protein EIP91_006829 [Steccherinum ochraceum]
MELEEIKCPSCSPSLAYAIRTALNIHPLSISFHDAQHLSSDIESSIDTCSRIAEQYDLLICKLKAKLNASKAFTCRLPEEILEQIFCFTLSDERGSVDAIRLSHVCSQWRAVALQSHRLWSSIVVDEWTNISLLNLLTSRAGLASCDIKIASRPYSHAYNISRNAFFYEEDFTDDELDLLPDRPTTLNPAAKLHSLLEAALDMIPRAESLNFSLENPKAEAYIFQLQALHLPALRSLSLRLGQRSEVPHLFTTKLPSLRHLDISLDFGPFSKDILALARPTVTSFQLTTIDGAEDDPTVGYALLTALQSMPQLRVLKLDGCFFPSPGPHVLPEDRTVLFCLEELHVWSEPGDLSWLLDHIRIPSTASIEVVTGGVTRRNFGLDPSPDLEDLANLGETLNTCLRSRKSLPTASIVTHLTLDETFFSHQRPFRRDLEKMDEHALRLKRCMCMEGKSCVPRDTLLGRNISLAFSHPQWPSCDGMSSLWGAFPDIRTLELNPIETNYKGFSWSIVLLIAHQHTSAFREVETLILNNWHPYWLWRLLLTNDVAAPPANMLLAFDGHHQPTVTVDTSPLCPKLKYITFRGIQLPPVTDAPDSGIAELLHETDEGFVPMSPVEVLRQTLHELCARRGPFKRIVFEDCDALTDDMMSSLDLPELLSEEVID